MLNPPGGFSTLTIDGVVHPCTPGTGIVINTGSHTITITGRPVKTSIEAMGAAGGGADSTFGAGPGGGGGAFALAFLLTLLPAKSYTFLAGAGGPSAGNGGTTSITNVTDAVTLLQYSGGLAGAVSTPGAGGTVVTGSGTPGSAGAAASGVDGGAGGNSGFGTGGGAGGVSGGSGQPGTVGGGGGGAAAGGPAGGAGADGFFAITFLA